MEEILNQYGKYIYNLSFKLTADPEQAKDLSQDTLLKAWEKRELLKNEAAAKAWLRKICLNLFRMNMRKKKEVWLEEDIDLLEEHGRLLTNEAAGPEEEVIVEEGVRELQNGCFLAMVRKLTLEQRMAFSLVDMFGVPLDEAAELMDISYGALKGLLYRARRSIDSFFAGHCEWIQSSNPCKCKAWISFWQNRDNNQQNMKKVLLEHLDYRDQKEYDLSSVRKKVKYLYETMPDRVPGQEWYENVISAFHRSEIS